MSRAAMEHCGGSTINFVPNQLKKASWSQRITAVIWLWESVQRSLLLFIPMNLRFSKGHSGRWRSIFCSNVCDPEHDRLLVVNQQVMIKVQTWFISFAQDWLYFYIYTTTYIQLNRSNRSQSKLIKLTFLTNILFSRKIHRNYET